MGRKGRILAVKTGYNPNSSSIGTDVKLFLKIGIPFVALVNIIGLVIAGKIRKNRKKDEDRDKG